MTHPDKHLLSGSRTTWLVENACSARIMQSWTPGSHADVALLETDTAKARFLTTRTHTAGTPQSAASCSIYKVDMLEHINDTENGSRNVETHRTNKLHVQFRERPYRGGMLSSTGS